LSHLALAQTASIALSPAGCVTRDANVVVAASVTPDALWSSVRLYFRRAGDPDFYYMEMRSAGDGAYWAALPLLGKETTAVEYYVAVRDAEARLDRVLQELEDARARREQRSMEFERSRLELEHLVATCREELGALPGELPSDTPQLDGLEMLDDDAALAGRIADARGRRDRVGPVNPLAEEEYEELSVRFETQSTQNQDLEATIAELNSSIKKMDRESKERFSEAFVEIRRHFREQFALLFRGGKADLLLEDESNPLESGVEIVCQPPGKKLQSVMLLSGGEKALAATAVLFAIFRYAPPPFCLLDEVDAPLDDANVGRFADALRGFADRTQFIVITHNKRSMEMADLLYGVTMAEPGVSKLVSMTLD
jgi:chromosome segregation protein